MRFSAAMAQPTLVFLYGPPAVGKLTVARAIADLTGFRVLHNHLVNDAAAALFDYFTDPMLRLVRQLRMTLVGAAAAGRVDVVHTYVYAPGDERLVADVVRGYQEVGGQVCFVRLTASPAELLRRVTAESRREFRKIHSPEILAALLDEYDCFQTIPGRRSLTVDTEAASPAEAADRIVTELGLPRR